MVSAAFSLAVGGKLDVEQTRNGLMLHFYPRRFQLEIHIQLSRVERWTRSL